MLYVLFFLFLLSFLYLFIVFIIMIYLSIGGSVTNELRYVRKTLLDWNFCRTGTLNADEVDETMLCAGESGIDACQVCFSF